MFLFLKFGCGNKIQRALNRWVGCENLKLQISIPVNSVCNSIPNESDLVKSIEFVKSIENSFPYNMIYDSAYLLALNVFISEIWV